MIHISYNIQSSHTHGIGLFADQDIVKGELIYTPNPLLDVDITPEEFDSLTKAEQREVEYYGYFHKKSQKWHVAFDAIRILNHGDPGKANVSQDEDMIMRATRDIAQGEELLQDYDEIYPRDGEHFARIGA